MSLWQRRERLTYSMNELYSILGISKQAFYQYKHRKGCFNKHLIELINRVDGYRLGHPRCGLEKMYHSLQPDFIGRDRFILIFKELGYGLKKKRNPIRTTYPSRLSYPNLINGLSIHFIREVWQSDITYFYTEGRFYYLTFLKDVYSRKIVGYKASKNLKAEANLLALQMAINDCGPPRIHHSDRGTQYTSNDYLDLLKSYEIAISMCGNAQENAYAERVNRTIKEEYLIPWQPRDFKQLCQMLNQAVWHYNNVRIHNSIGRKTPNEFEQICKSKGKDNMPEMFIFDYDNF